MYRPTRHRSPTLLPLIGWLIISSVAALAYLPGLNGGFQFDDFANLPSLGAFGPIVHWDTFWRYITSGQADPTGRPVTLLSFLIDAHDWPASPRSFLVTNLTLHLINGALLAWLLSTLGNVLVRGLSGAETDALRLRTNLSAVIGAGLWLLHPLLVSTTLYIVQREAMLPATFELLGLLAWLHGRRHFRDGRVRRGAIWVVGGLGAGTLLAVLSKADGALLPLLALVIEYALLRPAESTADAGTAPVRVRSYRCTMALVAGLPTLTLVTYMLWSVGPALVTGHSVGRPWTVGQRLITEPRVLLDYLKLLWIPRAFTSGLFNDQFTASRSLLHPWSTLPAILAVIGLIAGGWLLRKRLPALSLAVLFYFAGQLMESSILPLELYFEHRNYIPAMLMFWPLALWLCGVPQRVRAHAITHIESTTDQVHPIRIAVALACVAGLACLTYARTSLWGNVPQQALVWADINPGSPRAQANAAATEMQHGQFRQAVDRLRPALAKQPDQIQLALNLVSAECLSGHIDVSTLKATRRAMRHTGNPGSLLVHWFDRTISRTRHPPCPGLTLSMLDALAGAAQQNHALMAQAGHRQDVWYIKGRIALAQGHANQALGDFDRALSQQVRYAAALKQAALLGAAGHPALGLKELDHFRKLARHRVPPPFGMPRLHAWVLKRQHYWPHELARLRATLRHDAQSQKPAAAPVKKSPVK